MSEEKKYKVGDRLPGCIISQEEWDAVNKSLEDEYKPLDAAARKKYVEIFDKLAIKYCNGENEGKCLLCGKDQHHHTGLCDICLKAIKRGVMRQCGNVRNMSLAHKYLVCRICGAENPVAHGLCRKCYYKFFEKKDKEILTELYLKKVR